MLRLHLLRHGETTYSSQDRFCGTIDAPLNDRGMSQAEAFARRHVSVPWEAIWTSSRLRAKQTALPLADATGIRPLADARLDEISYGHWQGRSKSELQRHAPDELQRWLKDPTQGAPGGETVAGLAARLCGAVREITHAHPDGNVLIVSHKTALRVLICTLLQVPLAQYREAIPQPECALTVFVWSTEGPVLERLADTSHLSDLIETPANASTGCLIMDPRSGHDMTRTRVGG